MAETKKKAREPTFYHFVHASVFDRPLADKMPRENPSWLTATNSIGETTLAYVAIANDLESARFLSEQVWNVLIRHGYQETECSAS